MDEWGGEWSSREERLIERNDKAWAKLEQSVKISRQARDKAWAELEESVKIRRQSRGQELDEHLAKRRRDNEK